MNIISDYNPLPEWFEAEKRVCQERKQKCKELLEAHKLKIQKEKLEKERLDKLKGNKNAGNKRKYK